jgi:hypothetical protein
MGIQGIPFENCHEKSDIIAALKKHDGKISYVAKELGCSHEAIYRYMDRHPDVKEARAEAQKAYLNKRLDVSESVLDVLASKVHTDPGNALKSAIYTLNNLGKERGYAPTEVRAAHPDYAELLDTNRDPTNNTAPK